jgi:sugar lactone lactonase YvrE
MPDGSLLIVSMKDQRVLRGDSDGNVSTHADLSEFTDSSLSDMVVDERGRAWVGCFGFDLMSFADPQLAPLMRVDPDGTATVVAEGMMFPNGSVITPDGTTLIVGETAGCRYTAFTIQEDGTLSDRRVWVAPTPELAPLQEMLPQIAVGPDGCTLDAEPTAGRPTRPARAASASPPGARSWRRSTPPRDSAASPARSAARMAGPCSCAPHPTSSSPPAGRRARRSC